MGVNRYALFEGGFVRGVPKRVLYDISGISVYIRWVFGKEKGFLALRLYVADVCLLNRVCDKFRELHF